jgi:hypothetical protein
MKIKFKLLLTLAISILVLQTTIFPAENNTGTYLTIGTPQIISAGFPDFYNGLKGLDGLIGLYKLEGVSLEVKKNILLRKPFDLFLKGGILLGANSVNSFVYPILGLGIEYKIDEELFCGVGFMVVPSNLNLYLGVRL